MERRDRLGQTRSPAIAASLVTRMILAETSCAAKSLNPRRVSSACSGKYQARAVRGAKSAAHAAIAADMRSEAAIGVDPAGIGGACWAVYFLAGRFAERGEQGVRYQSWTSNPGVPG